MIQANELRIGNWALYPHTIHEPFQITEPRHIELAYLLKPIPLTTDILEACGFVKDDQGFHNLGKVSINMPGINGYAKGRLYFNSWFIKEPPKYLHELQNVVHALTGTELSINLEKVKV